MIKKIALGVMGFGILLFVGCASSAAYPTLEKDKDLATKNKPAGLNNMGSRYQFGDGVPRDYKKAFEYYQKASKMGLALAEANLGYMYDNGLGVKQNKQKAISLYKSAANKGEPRGMINLGEMYRTGDGIQQSLLKACQWYDKARFTTQLSKDREAKWASRGAMDKYCN